MVSYHLDRTPGGGAEPPNEVNPGIGVEWGRGRGAVHLGGYYNTIRTVSLYAGYERRLFGDRWARLGAVVGVVTGYPIFEVAPGLSIVPGATPFAEVGRGAVRPRLYALPFRGGVIAMQLRMQLP